MEHLDRILSLTGPGDRGVATIPHEMRTCEAIFFYSKLRSCVRAALVNALFPFEKGAAREFLNKQTREVKGWVKTEND